MTRIILDKQSDKLDTAEITRYSRHIFLPEISGAGQQKLKNSKVIVIGAGGLGSAVLYYLAAAGVGNITIVDFDIVDLSNLQRQIIHKTQNIGMNKAESAAIALSELNPNIKIKILATKLTLDNTSEILKNHDVIVDCCDNFTSRYTIADTAAALSIPCVLASIEKYNGQLTVLKPYENNNPSYRDIFPLKPDDNEIATCNTIGVLATLPGVIGSLQATETIKIITDIKEQLVGEMLVYYGLENKFHKIKY